jgi:arginyl-tRNA synthetase
MRIARFLDQHLSELLSGVCEQAVQTGQPIQTAQAAVQRSQNADRGDYQANGALHIAKKIGKSPREIAQAVVERLHTWPPIQSAEIAGPGFVNLTLATPWLEEQLRAMLLDTERDGVPAVEQPETIVVDYSGPNIAKQMHVGHLRSTILGHAMVRVLRFAGHHVIGDNHLGDWGTQFGLLIAGMREYGDREAFATQPIIELERIYKLAAERAKTDETFAAEARALLARLQQGDAELQVTWCTFVQVTLDDIAEVYQRLGVTFDTQLGESFYAPMLPDTVQELKDAGIATSDQGALCVFLDDEPELKDVKTPFIVQKQDGAFLYSTTDLATVLYRSRTLGATRALYVVDARQSLHFKQLFATIRKLGTPIALQHVGFGTILGSDGKPFKTRQGVAITLRALLDEACARARQRIADEQLEVTEDELEHVAQAVGLGAIKYADLKHNRLSDYRFDWDKMISFKGNSSPYLQYVYARIQSIFRKGQVNPEDIHALGPIRLTHPSERRLAMVLLQFADVVHDVAGQHFPHLICEHLYELAKAYSVFYESCPILSSEGDERRSRLALCALSARQMRRGLALLGIETLDRM